jgi:hypothetical protein
MSIGLARTGAAQASDVAMATAALQSLMAILLVWVAGALGVSATERPDEAVEKRWRLGGARGRR